MKDELAAVKEAFDNLKANGWNIEADLKWTFFFADSSKSKLIELFSQIDEKEFSFEQLNVTEEQSWVLVINKISTLTPEILLKIDQKLRVLARKNEIEFYDGWDVSVPKKRAPFHPFLNFIHQFKFDPSSN